jgi:hypothetical protein
MLYLQNLVNKKLHKELRLRNLIAHVALSKRLHKMQIEYNVEDYVPAEKKSKSFTEFLTHTHPRTNTLSSIALMSGLYKQYRAITLYNYKNNKKIL